MKQQWHSHSISAAYPRYLCGSKMAAIPIAISNCHIHPITILRAIMRRVDGEESILGTELVEPKKGL
jgi:hypothetical protein